jgi:hypothetical protein
MDKALAIVVVLIVCVLLGPLGVLLVIFFCILGVMFWKTLKRQLFDSSPLYRAQRRIVLVLTGIALSVFLIGSAGRALRVPGFFCPGKNEASVIAYECGLNQGKYMVENERGWTDDGAQERTARKKAEQNAVPKELMELFVQRYAEGFAAGQKQVKPE